MSVVNKDPVWVEKLSHDGRGITHIDGKITFIDGGLPGEQVALDRMRSHSKFNEAVVSAVITAAADRVTPACQHFHHCGGCVLQHIAPAQQIQHKQQVLQEHLQHFGEGCAPTEWLPALVGPAWHYRHKARLGVKYVIKKQKLVLGFREKKSSRIADLNHCMILHERVGLELPAFAELLRALSCYDQIPQLEVAVGDNATAIIMRHLKPLTAADETLLQHFAQQHNLWWYVQPQGPASITRLWPKDAALSALLNYQLPDFGLTLNFFPTQFTQINPVINHQMLRQALTLLELTASDSVLDLFCGIGNFTLPIATLAASVVGVEGDESLTQQAHANAVANQLTNCEFHTSNLYDQNFQKQTWCRKHYDKVLIDPPRTGAAEIIPWLTKLAPRRIVYVSCNPATFARDAGLLLKNGYKMLQCGVMDMFPHTNHVESMAVFVPNKA